MSTEIIKGVIIKEDLYNESDKLLTILTKNKGLIRIYAKYARKPGKNMLVSTSILSFCEFQVSINDKKGNFLNDATLVESFSKIKNDVVALTYCSHICELILDSMVDEISSNETYELILYTFYQFNKSDERYMFLLSVFEMKLLNIMGFMPILGACVKCSEKIIFEKIEKVYFDLANGGVLCNRNACKVNSYSNIKKISKTTYYALQYISNSSFEKLFSFKLNDKDEHELSELATEYICEKFEKCYTKLEMLKDFNV